MAERPGVRTGLCGPCGAVWLRWLDYRVRPPLAIHTVGNRIQDVDQRRESQYRRWRNTILSQQALIERACAAGRHARVPRHEEEAVDRW